jgi:hypothetical protein
MLSRKLSHNSIIIKESILKKKRIFVCLRILDVTPQKYVCEIGRSTSSSEWCRDSFGGVDPLYVIIVCCSIEIELQFQVKER